MEYFVFFMALSFTVSECFGQRPTPYTSDCPAPVNETILWIGPMIGINFNNYQTASFPYPGIDPAVIFEQNGKGRAPMFGISCEIPMDLINRQKIVIEALYDSKSAASNSGYASNVDLTKIIGENVQGVLVTDLNTSLTYLTLGLGYKYNFTEAPVPDGFGIQLSVNTGINIINHFNKTVNAVWPDPSGTQGAKISVTNVTSIPIDGVHIFRIGLDGKVSYDIPASRKVNVSPYVGYDFALSKVDDDRSWKTNSFFVGITAHYSLVINSKYY